ncbi:MAG: nicotinate (nicotinamide) nucleotide adenylyltransferase [Desulfovibrionales bacterium]
MAKVGILGGSFNPVHLGHLRLAVVVLEEMALDRLDLVPAAVPPHKRNEHLLPFEFRLALLRASIEGRKKVAVNPLERERQGPSYTVDTLRQYRAHNQDDELYFVLGSTDLLTLPSWHEWQEICSLANLVVTDRGGRSSWEIDSFLAQHIPGSRRLDERRWQLASGTLMQHVAFPRMDLSSTMIRTLLQQGRSIAFLVPEQVERMLVAHGSDFF